MLNSRLPPRGDGSTLELSRLIQEYDNQTAGEALELEENHKSWNLPKAHSYKHAFDDIINKGVARNYPTKINENMHGPLKKAYQLQSNFRNFAPQILRIDHCAYVASIIEERITEFDRRKKLEDLKNTPSLIPEDGVNDGEEAATEAVLSQEGLVLSVPTAMWSFQALEDRVMPDIDTTIRDPAFSQFRLRFQRFLSGLDRQYPDQREEDRIGPGPFVFRPEDTIIHEHRMVKSYYRSVVNWQIRCDFIRANPDFHGSSRYDAVLISSSGGEHLFARLHFICPYDSPRGAVRVVEREMGLYRVKARLRKESYFIPVRTIVWGAVLVERFGQNLGDDEFFVMDDVDEDMSLRIQDMQY
ncbi:hypothetical protein V5O48_016110 [Marasmius crinis-equi]|uniref:WYL domain-containing protein n=1 Tax=Marasmius crinis-equi TaxID=585013 RepID=A0ABR3ESY7_9AGAR